MKILVCIKQVPALEQMGITENPGGEVEINEFSEYRMNRFDEFAIEEAIRIKQQIPACTVDVLTVGPERACDVVRRAMGMGADHGILIYTEKDVSFCPSLIAKWIAAYASEKDYDLILTGSMSEDGMNGQVGSMVAGNLRLPAATQVICTALSDDQSEVYAEREIEKGQREMIQLRLPAVLAIQTGANQPRYPSLSNLLRANKQALEQIEAGSLSEEIPKEALAAIAIPRKNRAGEHLNGSAEEKAIKLLNLLHDKAFI